MSKSNTKKRKLFIDLSEDIFVQKEDSKKIINKTENIVSHNKSVNSEKLNKIEKNPNFLNKYEQTKKQSFVTKPSLEQIPEKIIETNDDLKYIEHEPEKQTSGKSTVISEALNIMGEEPLNKGFHFYSNDRVMDKVKRCAKEKNIKLSRLITIILDKTIREE